MRSTMCTIKIGNYLLLAAALLLLLLLSTAAFCDTADDDYCHLGYCRPDQNHIACNYYGEPSPDCPTNVQYVSMLSFKPFILGTFNNLRNLVAGGTDKFESAARMATMQWDSDLADLALIRAMSCTDALEGCFASKKFPSPGQGIMLSTLDTHKYEIVDLMKQIVTKAVNYSEKFDATFAKRFPANFEHPLVSIFGHIIQDLNAYIGCAATTFMGTTKQMFLFVCNFSTEVPINEALYKSGPAISGCKTGKNPFYPNLCSIYENYVFQWKKKRLRHFMVLKDKPAPFQ